MNQSSCIFYFLTGTTYYHLKKKISMISKDYIKSLHRSIRHLKKLIQFFKKNLEIEEKKDRIIRTNIPKVDYMSTFFIKIYPNSNCILINIFHICMKA